MLEVNHITKSFRRKKVLENISCRLEAKTYGLLGSNGAGKTTFLRCIAGLYALDQGDILWKGTSISGSKEYTSKIGYLPQKFEGLKELTVKECLEFFGDMKEMENSELEKEITRVLAMVNLEEFFNRRVKTLSGGMIRRLGIAQAIMNYPEILIFDEPTAGLDPEERLRFKNLVMHLQSKKLIIISTHIVDDIEVLCDEIIVLDSGRLLGVFTPEMLIKKARGKVYEVDESELLNIKGDYKVIKEYRVDQSVKIRILTEEVQNFETIEPTIEDGYLWIKANALSMEKG